MRAEDIIQAGSCRKREWEAGSQFSLQKPRSATHRAGARHSLSPAGASFRVLGGSIRVAISSCHSESDSYEVALMGPSAP